MAIELPTDKEAGSFDAIRPLYFGLRSMELCGLLRAVCALEADAVV